jgi:hypothetical protein
MKNHVVDLCNHLFAEMERLGDEDLKGSELKDEIARGRAMTGVASQIIAAGSLSLKAARDKAQAGAGFEPPALLAEKAGWRAPG